MTSEQKLKEISFFLDLVNQYYQDDEKCEYCLSAFLHASYDLLEHTFVEYRNHFRIEIQADARDERKAFIATAKEKQAIDALGFMALYTKELRKLYTNPISASMLIIRNANTHEETNLTPFSTFTEYPDGRREFDSKYFLASHDLALPFFKEDLQGYVTAKTNHVQKVAKLLDFDLSPATPDDLIKIYVEACQILSKKDVRIVCDLYLKLLQGFVSAIRADYPRW